ncbi:MAG: hypothetical protein HZC36_03195 [Armatimonadetes bacterium]|nr:hypothetical protein [Armatimonadota bacterium]
MPIHGHHISFNRGNILNLTTEEGVYELFSDEAIYFGQSEDDPRGIRGRLERHLSGELSPGPEIVRDFRFEVNSRPDHRVAELIEEYVHEHGEYPRFNPPAEAEKVA